MLKKKKKEKLISQARIHKTDTGSADVQIALLSEQIASLAKHLKKHPKDKHSRLGLLKMVQKRKSLLNYLKKESEQRYKKIVKKLGLKK